MPFLPKLFYKLTKFLALSVLALRLREQPIQVEFPVKVVAIRCEKLIAG